MGKNIVLLGEHRLPASVSKTRILIVCPIMRLSTLLDLENIEKIELRTIDNRLIGTYVMVQHST